MSKEKQSFYTVSARLSEQEKAQLAKDRRTMSVSDYIRFCLFYAKKLAGVPVQEILPQLQQCLALLGKTRLHSLINQIAHHLHCGTFQSTPEVETAILELRDDIRFIRDTLMELVKSLREKAR